MAEIAARHTRVQTSESMVGVGGTMSHKLKRGRALSVLSERADSKVERIDMATQHSQKEWRRLQDGLVAGEHGQDH